LQTLHDNHRRSLRTTSGELRTSQRRILSCDTETICLVTRLTVSCENLLAAIVRRKFGCLLGALRTGNLFDGWHLTAVRVWRFSAKISRVTAKISAAKKYC